MPVIPALILFAVIFLSPCLVAMANSLERHDPYDDYMEPRFGRATIMGIPGHTVAASMGGNTSTKE